MLAIVFFPIVTPLENPTLLLLFESLSLSKHLIF